MSYIGEFFLFRWLKNLFRSEENKLEAREYHDSLTGNNPFITPRRDSRTGYASPAGNSSYSYDEGADSQSDEDFLDEQDEMDMMDDEL